MGALQMGAKKIAKEWVDDGHMAEDFSKWQDGGKDYPELSRRRWVAPEGRTGRWDTELHSPGSLLSDVAKGAGVDFTDEMVHKIQKIIIDEIGKLKAKDGE